MDQEDNEFFVLVLGVLAAIILVVSWWFWSQQATPAVGSDDLAIASESHDTAGEAEHDSSDSSSDDSAHRSGSDDSNNDGQAAAQSDGNHGDDTHGDDTQSDGNQSDGTQGAGDGEAAADDALPATVFDVLAGEPSLGVITGLLRDNGLDATLTGDGPFTVFAPTDDAVSIAAGSDTTVDLLEAKGEQLLSYHVVPGDYSYEDLTNLATDEGSTELTTTQGEVITLSVDGDRLVLNGNTTLAPFAYGSGNGVVHLIDNVLVPPIAALNTLVQLEPILFETGSASISQESFGTLDRLIEVLSTSTANVTIGGHTDNTGDPLVNQNLSEERARSVVNYLVASGIDETRLTAQGFGPSEPIADNDTEEGRALNRRIEFTLS